MKDKLFLPQILEPLYQMLIIYYSQTGMIPTLTCYIIMYIHIFTNLILERYKVKGYVVRL